MGGREHGDREPTDRHVVGYSMERDRERHGQRPQDCDVQQVLGGEYDGQTSDD